MQDVNQLERHIVRLTSPPLLMHLEEPQQRNRTRILHPSIYSCSVVVAPLTTLPSSWSVQSSLQPQPIVEWMLPSTSPKTRPVGSISQDAQQLPASITSASKLQAQMHQLYLLKDGQSNGGRGVAVGFLKVGYKKLFLLDQQGAHIEAEPLCVLDFYIAENLQRHGYGRELFDFMLQLNQLEPVLMAYDRPSPKFLSFLAKHFSLTPSVPQANNFVVFQGFFLNRSGGPSSARRHRGLDGCL